MILEFSIFVFLFCALAYFVQRKPKNNLPGPWGLPLVGHLPLLGANPCKKLMEWKKIYGPIYFIQFGSFPTVVLNDAKLIKKAFNLPAFSGRAQIDSFMEGTEGKGIGLSEGRDNREQRQFVLRTLKTLSGSIEASSHENISDLVDYLQKMCKSQEPIKVNNLLTPFVLNGLTSILMGRKFSRQDEQLEHIIHLIHSGTKFDSLLEQIVLFMPWIGKLLGRHSGHLKRVAIIKTVVSYMADQIELQKKTWIKGQPRHFTDAYLDKIGETEDIHSSFHSKRNFQPQLNVDLFSASLDTTVTSLEWLVYYLAKYPHVQKNVQKEIDHVVGNSRLPCLSDRGQLPYCEALILELLRYSSIVPIGVFHRTLTDVEFCGYQLLGNTMIISDLHSVHHDEVTWGDPEIFRPERFIENGKVKKAEGLLAFSTGRRSCVGEQAGWDQLFLYTTAICQTFNIQFPPEIPQVTGIFGLSLAPSQFSVYFSERTLNDK